MQQMHSKVGNLHRSRELDHPSAMKDIFKTKNPENQCLKNRAFMNENFTILTLEHPKKLLPSPSVHLTTWKIYDEIQRPRQITKI